MPLHEIIGKKCNRNLWEQLVVLRIKKKKCDRWRFGNVSSSVNRWGIEVSALFSIFNLNGEVSWWWRSPRAGRSLGIIAKAADGKGGSLGDSHAIILEGDRVSLKCQELLEFATCSWHKTSEASVIVTFSCRKCVFFSFFLPFSPLSLLFIHSSIHPWWSNCSRLQATGVEAADPFQPSYGQHSEGRSSQ